MRLLIIVALALFWGLACRDQAPVPGSGTYVLEAITGQPLPYETCDFSTCFTFYSGSLDLRRDHSFVETWTYKSATIGLQPDTITTTRSGSWTLTGSSALDFASGTGLQRWTGILDRDTVSVNGFRYRRR